MSDEQRRAMFARMRGGGGGGGRRRAAENAAASVGDVPLNTEALAHDLYSNPVQNPSDPYAAFASPSYGQDTSFVTSPGEPSAIDKALANLILGLSGARAITAIPQLAAWASSLGPTGQALLKAVQSWKTPLASGAAAWGIGEYREANPTMDPRGEKALAIAQQIASYVSAITGLGTAKGQIGRALPSGVKSAVTGGLKTAGTWLEDLGKAIGGYMPSGVKGALSKLYGGYTKVADYTGASISDVLSTQNTTEANIKRALVIAGFAAKETQEEMQIRGIQSQMEAQWAQGEDYVFDPADPRGPLGSAVAFAAGTLGNPIEKQFRYGQDSYATQVAAYRARYDAIGQAEASGEMSPGEAESERQKLAEDKPQNMAGKGAWTFAPASAAFLSWQAGNVKDYFDHEVEVGRVDKVLDGDTIEVAGKKIRMLGVDTPESVHPNKPVEYLGPEASHFQKDNLTGKTVRLVQSPGVDTDKYGRALRYVETLPGPLDAAFNLPGVGKWIPGTDENKRLIDEGYGQPRYLELSGGHERQIEYDKATARAKAAGKGVHSAEGMQQLDYHYQTYDEKHGRTNAPPDSALQTALGLGLMATGQSGAFKAMGPSGNVAAQTWNALLAGLGTADYNEKARLKSKPVRYKPPKTVKTEYETQAQSVIDARRSRSARP
jgi:endonuclease YncB( thermonuclease family)